MARQTDRYLSDPDVQWAKAQWTEARQSHNEMMARNAVLGFPYRVPWVLEGQYPELDRENERIYIELTTRLAARGLRIHEQVLPDGSIELDIEGTWDLKALLKSSGIGGSHG